MRPKFLPFKNESILSLTMAFTKITEQSSLYRDLEHLPVRTLLENINAEDHKVADAVEKNIPEIEQVVNAVAERMEQGGRLFYVGAGTSGRLGVLDASELPPTYGVSPDLVIGIIAGGEKALRNAVEGAEDDDMDGWFELEKYDANEKDSVIGIAASGTTPFVVGALRECKKRGIFTACITSNTGAPISKYSDVAIETIVGPEFVTGSSRMKSGTAQKLVLNMISTTLMIRLGRVRDNKMVNMQLSNEKLIDRGTRILANEFSISYDESRALLLKYGSVANVEKIMKKR